nr:hypothetical protein [Treponema sp.]
EEIADAEPVEDLEEGEEVTDAEPVEDLEEVEEIAAAEPVEDLEEVEEIAAAEPVEDLEEVEEIADAEPVDDLEEVEEIADAEPVEDLEEVEEIADAEPVEDLEEVEEVTDAEPVEDLEEVEEIADAEPVEDLEEVEEVTDAEPVEDLEEVEEIVDVDDFEELAASLTNDIAEKKRKSRIPEYDISEDVGSDFFAIKKDKNEAAAKEDNSAAVKAHDPFYGVRDSFKPNEETEEVVNQFSISDMNYKGLDANTNELKLNGTLESEKKEYDKELSLEDFGIQAKKENEAFSEPIEMSAPKNPDEDDSIDIASTFTTEKPHFERDALNFFAKEKETKKAEEDAKFAESLKNAKEAIPVSNSQSFMFSSFGQSSNFAELQIADFNPIVQDENGVFSINDGLKTGGVVQDNSFKRLVDSVLNKA